MSLAPAGAKVDLFAEGPTPDWALPRAGNRSTARPPVPQPLRLRARRACRPVPIPRARNLKLTAVAGTEAIETDYRLDQAPRCPLFCRRSQQRPPAGRSSARGIHDMAIKVGDTLPNTTFRVDDRGGPEAEARAKRCSRAARWCCSRCRAPSRRPARRTTCRAS